MAINLLDLISSTVASKTSGLEIPAQSKNTVLNGLTDSIFGSLTQTVTKPGGIDAIKSLLTGKTAAASSPITALAGNIFSNNILKKLNLGSLLKDDALLTNTANYDVQSVDGYTLVVTPIDRSMFTANNKEYLEGMTHILTLTADLKSPRDEVRIALRNELPAWVRQSSSESDTSAGGSFPTTTLGLEHLLGGMFDAMKGGSSFFDVTIHLKR